MNTYTLDVYEKSDRSSIGEREKSRKRRVATTPRLDPDSLPFCRQREREREKEGSRGGGGCRFDRGIKNRGDRVDPEFRAIRFRLWSSGGGVHAAPGDFIFREQR